jgi:hypothetical protein
MGRPLTDPEGEKKQPITVFLAPRYITYLDTRRRPGESRGDLITRLLQATKGAP